MQLLTTEVYLSGWAAKDYMLASEVIRFSGFLDLSPSLYFILKATV